LPSSGAGTRSAATTATVSQDEAGIPPSSCLSRALGERADPIEMRVVRARVPQRIEFADEVPADVDYARVLRLE